MDDAAGTYAADVIAGEEKRNRQEKFKLVIFGTS